MTNPYYEDAGVKLFHGDCLDVLRSMPDASVHAVVTDPPYGLEFMGKEWDAPWKQSGAVIKDPATERGGFQDGNGGNAYSRSRSRIEYGRGGDASVGFQEWCELWARECLRVLKPGGYMLAFGGSRTWHRLACAVEDSGFEIRDSIAWLYGSGFPKSMDVSKAIDKALGAEREITGRGAPGDSSLMGGLSGVKGESGHDLYDEPVTPAAAAAAGWGTALKPAFEPIVVGRKPIVGTVAQNFIEHGTGAINVDASRTSLADGRGREQQQQQGDYDGSGSTRIAGTAERDKVYGVDLGRWPTNVVCEQSQADALDEQSGVRVSRRGTLTSNPGDIYGGGKGLPSHTGEYGFDDSGGPSRFFPTFHYEAKAPGSERPDVDGVQHPTVKPLDLMRWLVRLVASPGAIILEPFAGSGTTLEACLIEGFEVIGIEREESYLPLIMQRIRKPLQQSLFGEFA